MRPAPLLFVLAATLAVHVGAAAPAVAAPEIRGTRTEVAGGKLVVVLDTTLAARGRATVEGTVNGRKIRGRKGIGAGERTARLTLDPRRARIRKANGALVFDLVVRVDARRERAEQSVSATVGVPVIVLPGLGNESTPGGFDLFATGLDNAAGGAWGAGGAKASIVVHEYASRTKPLTELARGLDRVSKLLLKGSVFRQVDVVGYSMGGLVAREWMQTPGGRGRVRKLVFLGTPNEGAPVAYLAAFAAKSGALDAILANAGGGALTGALDGILNAETVGALSNFYPTYDWATISLFPGAPPGPIPSFLLNSVLGVEGADDPPLATLNAAPPDPKTAEIHAFFYSSVLTEAFGVNVGTIDVVDLTPILGGLAGGAQADFSTLDIASLASGDGDGIAPAHSVRMDGVPAWKARIVPHDLGAGSHVTFALDPQVFAGVAGVLTK